MVSATQKNKLRRMMRKNKSESDSSSYEDTSVDMGGVLDAVVSSIKSTNMVPVTQASQGNNKKFFRQLTPKEKIFHLQQKRLYLSNVQINEQLKRNNELLETSHQAQLNKLDELGNKIEKTNNVLLDMFGLDKRKYDEELEKPDGKVQVEGDFKKVKKGGRGAGIASIGAISTAIVSSVGVLASTLVSSVVSILSNPVVLGGLVASAPFLIKKFMENFDMNNELDAKLKKTEDENWKQFGLLEKMFIGQGKFFEDMFDSFGFEKYANMMRKNRIKHESMYLKKQNEIESETEKMKQLDAIDSSYRSATMGLAMDNRQAQMGKTESERSLLRKELSKQMQVLKQQNQQKINQTNSGQRVKPYFNTQAIKKSAADMPDLQMPNKTVGDALDNAAKVVGVNKGILYAMARQESSFNPSAKAGTSSATGLFQFIDSTWASMVAKYGDKFPVLNRGRMDPEASAIAGALYIKENEKALKSQGIAVNGTNLYASHFLGPNGAKTLLKADGNINAASLLPSAAAANKSIFYNKDGSPRSVSDVIDVMYGKVGSLADRYEAGGLDALFSSNPTLSSAYAKAKDYGNQGINILSEFIGKSPEELKSGKAIQSLRQFLDTGAAGLIKEISGGDFTTEQSLKDVLSTRKSNGDDPFMKAMRERKYTGVNRASDFNNKLKSLFEADQLVEMRKRTNTPQTVVMGQESSPAQVNNQTTTTYIVNAPDTDITIRKLSDQTMYKNKIW